MKVILIDDEQLAIDVLEILLNEIEAIEIVGKYTDPQIALLDLPKLNADVVFLDMEMGGLHGLEFSEILQTEYPYLEVVFVTAHPQFALDAFEVSAIDYLLKPVNRERMNKAIIKLQERLAMYKGNNHNESIEEKVLSVQVMGDFRLLDMDGNEIKWRTRKVKELFILLWHHRDKGIHRSQVMVELWQELSEDRAKALMHTTVYQLRKVIKEIGFENPVILRNGQYVLNIPVESDFDKLKKELQSPLTTHSTLKNIKELYQGDYLEIEDYHWALPEQKEIKRMLLQHLERYVAIAKDDESEAHLVEACLEGMVQLEPYSENYIYLLLDHYGRINNIQKMIALFQEVKMKWIDELGIDLPNEMIEVYEKHITY